MPQEQSPKFAVEMLKIKKDFFGIQVLKDVSLRIQAGEIHALVGENGAGKSTLMKILGGIYPHKSYQGELKLFGESVAFHSIQDAEKAGIVMVHQELSLVPELSIAENIFLGRLPQTHGVVNREKLNQDAWLVLEQLGLKFDPDQPVRNLSIGCQQLVAIGRALAKKAKVLILDEPTAALPEAEVSILFALIRSLKKQGVTCIYISHRLAEVFAISDQTTVLRDGALVDTLPTQNLDHRSIVNRMVGRSFDDIFPSHHSVSNDIILTVQKLAVPHPTLPHRMLLGDINLTVSQGEILGVAGLMGSGRSVLLNTIYGALQLPRKGRIIIDNLELSNHTPMDSIRAGMSLVTEERKKDGLVMGLSVRENITIASLKAVSRYTLLQFARERALVDDYIKTFDIKTNGMEQYVNHLSGGNQQKVILAKWLATRPKVLLLDEPTRGIDVGAKTEIYQLISQLAAKGVAIVMVSSELPEILGLSHRVLVMHEGSIAGILDHNEATEEKIMMLATGDDTNCA